MAAATVAAPSANVRTFVRTIGGVRA
jgi:hypothetical protein